MGKKDGIKSNLSSLLSGTTPTYLNSYRQANRAGGEKECYKYLLPKNFATYAFESNLRIFCFSLLLYS